MLGYFLQDILCVLLVLIAAYELIRFFRVLDKILADFNRAPHDAHQKQCSVRKKPERSI